MFIKQSYFHSILILVFSAMLPSCNDKDDSKDTSLNYRQEMRNFVIEISEYAKAVDSDFLIIPQNGIELVSEENGVVNHTYLNAIDANGQESLFYGYEGVNTSTSNSESNRLINLLKISQKSGNRILVTDYCYTHSKMDDSYVKNHSNEFISFSADERLLNNIPSHPSPIYAENNSNIDLISKAKNFIFIINPEDFNSKESFISAMEATNYDLIIIDFFFDAVAFSANEVSRLKIKANGGSRLVISYLSIGEAEDYRYYWQQDWYNTSPKWLTPENPEWKGNYKVKYWDSDWKSIIYGNESSYLKKILAAGFDGVYLDIIDAFEYFEE
ncbi:endo alpha-1,4 polygalactosaminidase [Roseivirga echinicomitans]|uniref:Glycoside-hydrolase family GH114 TIM-barrel domain-containing protein n=1 Tax=Roseivirga echinicomitans TaxID=296218 RepID=A0A150XU85_9BACT|nr:endo alpha-1,4 polygalactosaminidase [Roseivirga echinicomitans]KYG82307.1 hypothetical protein AWN68_15825 [Roseivirga echinicomitans]